MLNLVFMSGRYKFVFCILLALSFSNSVPAQRLPELPQDPVIEKGVLRCGVTYYLVADGSAPGFADMAFVSRDDEMGSGALDAAFFYRHGVTPRQEGFREVREGSAVFRFDHIPVYDPAVLDSTLLESFALVAASHGDNAIVLSGDIDKADIKKKLDIFSMMVPRRQPRESGVPDYVWEPAVLPSIVVEPAEQASVTVTYASPRVPGRMMNTAQFLASDILSREFLTLLQHRLERMLSRENVPWSKVEAEHVGSHETVGDEQYRVTVVTGPDYVEAAMKSISRTLSSLDEFGVPVREFADAKAVMMPEMTALGTSTRYLERCIAHFLYGGTLSSPQQEVALFARKNVSEDTETRLLNDFASALMSSLQNLTVEYRTPGELPDEEDVLFQYNLGYLYGSTIRDTLDDSWHSGDSLSLEVAPPRVKIKSVRDEPVTGGEMWTLSNGIRVIYHPVFGGGEFRYAFVLPGGLTTLPALTAGEGGYLGDMLSLYGAAGLSATGFRDLLAARGISLDTEVNLRYMTLSGRAPRNGLGFLLKALLALANDRKADYEAFESYRRSSVFEASGTDATLFSMLYPGFPYTRYKHPGALSDQTRQQAEQYFTARFAQCSDAILVLSGDLDDEAAVKKLLLQYMGGFSTDGAPAPREGVKGQPITGVRTHTVEGAEKSIEMLVDAQVYLTGVNLPASNMAVEVLKRAIARRVARYGLTVRIVPYFSTYPHERLRVRISCGVPSGADAGSALTAVREGIKAAPAEPFTAADLAAFKRLTGAKDQARERDAAAVVDDAVLRYAVGKDLVSKRKENLESVTEAKVRAVLQAIADGGRAEYVTR